MAADFPSAIWDGLSANTERENLQVYLSPDGDDWKQIVDEVIAIETRLGTSSVGASNGSAVAATESVGVVNKTVLTLTDLEVDMTDAGAAGCHGSHKIYDFPEGAIMILGAVSDLTTLAGAGGIADDAALVGSVGTEAAGVDNATLTSAEADIIPSTTGTLTSGAGTLDGVSTTALIATFDGTTTPADAYLNIAVPDADSTADDTVTVNGTVTITWVHLGDK